MSTSRTSRPLAIAMLAGALALTSGCERIKQQLAAENASGQSGDPVWQGDSTMLASSPTLIFRLFDHPKGRAIAPIATAGAQGFRPVTMGRRGWRALDLNYLQAGHQLDAIREGRLAGSVTMSRGMWQSGEQLDSLPGCPRIIPAGLVNAPSGVNLAMTGGRPALKAVTPLSAGELQDAIATVPTLIAPSSGIATSMLARYKRDVYVLNTGTGARPSILVTYDDPEPVADTLRPIAQRPRQFLVVLDKGVYGYKATYTFATLGNALSLPKQRFLDYVDVDGDGKAELFFGFLYNKMFDGTLVLRFENDAWREAMREPVRCQL